MNNLWLLLKIQLYSLGLNKLIHRREQSKRELGLALLAVLLVPFLAGTSTLYSLMISYGLETIGALELLPAIMMTAGCITVLFTTIYKVGNTLFGFRDYDMLMSLPIKTSTIIFSRLMMLYILNLLFTLVVMVPAGIIFLVKSGAGISNWVLFFITLPAVPLIPIIAASVIGTLITEFVSRFKYKNILLIFLSLAAMVCVVAFSFVSSSFTGSGFVSAIDMLKESLYRYYPPSMLYFGAVSEGGIASGLLFLGVSLASFALFCFIVRKSFIAICTAFNTSRKTTHFELKALRTSPPFYALLKRELWRYINCPIYAINTATGSILLLIASIAALFFGSGYIAMLEAQVSRTTLCAAVPIAMGFFISMGSTTASSVSLEGKTLWQLKVLPINELSILASKLSLNLLINAPAIVLASLVSIYLLKPDVLTALFILFLPWLYNLFISLAGLVINLIYPRLDWSSETTVVKQSLSVLLTLLAGFAGVGLPAVLFILGVNTNFVLILSALFLALTCTFLWTWLKSIGIQFFRLL